MTWKKTNDEPETHASFDENGKLFAEIALLKENPYYKVIFWRGYFPETMGYYNSVEEGKAAVAKAYLTAMTPAPKTGILARLRKAGII